MTVTAQRTGSPCRCSASRPQSGCASRGNAPRWRTGCQRDRSIPPSLTPPATCPTHRPRRRPCSWWKGMEGVRRRRRAMEGVRSRRAPVPLARQTRQRLILLHAPVCEGDTWEMVSYKGRYMGDTSCCTHSKYCAGRLPPLPSSSCKRRPLKVPCAMGSPLSSLPIRSLPPSSK